MSFSHTTTFENNKYVFNAELFSDDSIVIYANEIICKLEYKVVLKTDDIRNITQKANTELNSNEFMAFMSSALQKEDPDISFKIVHDETKKALIFTLFLQMKKKFFMSPRKFVIAMQMVHQEQVDRMSAR